MTVRPPTMPPAPKAYQFHELVAAIEKRLDTNGRYDATDADIKEVLDELTAKRTQEIYLHQGMINQRKRIEDVVYRHYIRPPETKGN